jgi:hypothetical protein
MNWPMLARRSAVYYHRQVVPLALRPLLKNRREIWKSLRTTDLEEAKLLDVMLRRSYVPARPYSLISSRTSGSMTITSRVISGGGFSRAARSRCHSGARLIEAPIDSCRTNVLTMRKKERRRVEKGAQELRATPEALHVARGDARQVRPTRRSSRGGCA